MSNEPNDAETAERSTTSERTASAGNSRFSRRAALSLLGVGGLGLAAGSASASPSGRGNQPFYNWSADVEANGHRLAGLGSLSMADNSTAITDFAGENLAIDDGGVLNADVGDRSWEDVNDDGLLEAPGHDGVDVATVRADDASVGGSLEFDGTQFAETVDIAAVAGSGLPDFWHVAASDAELDDVMNDLSDGDRIVLGPAEFADDREFNESVRVVGSSAGVNGTDVRGDWTFHGYGSGLQEIHSGSQYTTITFENKNCFMWNCTSYSNQANVVVNGDYASFSMIRDWEIHFSEGTTGGHVGVGTNVSTEGDGEYREIAYR